MAKPYSDDLRQKVMQAIIIDGMDKTEASRVFNISRNTIYLWFKRQAISGNYKALPNRPPGNNHKIICWDKFREFVEIHGDKTKAQMAALWPEYITQRTISRAVKKIGFTRKKTFGYQERDQEKRDEFLAEMSGIAEEDIVYASESGMDDRDQYQYGYNECGQRFHALKTGQRSSRINIVAALCNGQILDPFTLEGACNRTVFELWLENYLIPALKPGQVVVIDNATFHKGGRIQELILGAGCRLLYLPPYSPDLNKIEQCWSWLKARIRKCMNQFDSLHNAMDHILALVS